LTRLDCGHRNNGRGRANVTNVGGKTTLIKSTKTTCLPCQFVNRILIVS